MVAVGDTKKRKTRKRVKVGKVTPVTVTRVGVAVEEQGDPVGLVFANR